MTEWTVNNKLNAWYQKRYHIKLPKEFETKSEIYFGGSSFSPSALFALAEPGVWFDPSDLTTLFQDPAGTTPVTAPGNTVGLMLDKSRGLALGAELVSNGDFSAGSTGWTGGTVSGGQISIPLFNEATQAISLTAGRTYRVSFDINASAGMGRVTVGATLIDLLNVSRVGAVYYIVTANTTALKLGCISGTSVSFDNISVRELAGNHATQATLAARPTYSIEPVGGRRNLLLWSEDYSNAAWTKYGATVSGSVITSTSTSFSYVAQLSTAAITAVTHTLSAKVKAGTSSVFWIYYDSGAASGTAYFDLSDLSTQVVAGSSRSPSGLTIENLGGGDYRISAQWLTTVGNPTWGVGISNAKGSLASTVGRTGTIYNAQAELGPLSPYQRVTTQHDVTEAGVASVGYLYFDGVNDAMATSTITPGIDKAQVFAGVRKLSDALAGVLIEFSASVGSEAGSFSLTPGDFNTGAGPYWKHGARGSAGLSSNQFAISPASYAAPITNVLSGQSDIAGDISTLRVNGTQQATATGDKGTGNFLAYPLYLGGRAGTSLFFLGHLYSLIARFGPTLDAPTITSTEIWVGDKTGIDIAKNISTTIYTRSGDTILDRANSTIERRAV